MTTLTTPPLSTLLARLFAEAQATDATLDQKAAELSPEERAKLMTSATDYQALYSRPSIYSGCGCRSRLPGGTSSKTTAVSRSA